ncbi:RNA polymerase sigma factor [Rhodococcus koreensis]|uniref:RNA polymerase sigma factor n=1 Tax=Rhodococcus koreensis TaxID=99653 RepID=UPI0036DB79FA
MNDTSSALPGGPIADSELVARAQSGDARAMSQLLARHFDYVHILCRRMLRNPADAEDARQEALFQATRNIATFHGRCAFRTWLHTVTRNVCLNAIRSGTRRDIPVDELPPRRPSRRSPQDSVATRLDVEAALAAIPDPFRDPVVLRYLCDLDYAQIARVLGRELGTVRSQLHRGRSMLMALLDENVDDSG